MADSAPDNVVPNIHPALYFGISTLAFVLSAICVGLRVYVRAFMTKSFGLDDWTLIAAFVSTIMLASM